MMDQPWHSSLRPLCSRVIHALALSTCLCIVVPESFGQSLASAGSMTTTSAVPRLIKYSGTLLDGRGYPITVPVDVTFALYGQQTSGNKPALWQETQHVSPNDKGVYTVYLGSSSASGLPSEVFTAVSAQWLGIRVEGETELARVLLASVPYALKAGDAQTLGGLPASAFALAGSTLTSSNSVEPSATVTPNATSTVTTTGGTSGYLPKFTGASTVGNSQVFVSSAGMAINKTSPAAVLDVNGDMIVRGPTIVARTGNATSSKGYPSYGFDFYSNVYNSSTKVADNPHFILQSEPVGNNTSSTSATFNVLYSNQGKTAESGFSINPNGTLHFSPSQTFPGTVASVGLTAPSSDFTVYNSPVTNSGTLGFYWNVSPTASNAASAIVKRDASGAFQAGAITGTSLGTTGSLTVLNTSFMAAANLSGPVGIGTNSPQAQLNLNKNNAANGDNLLIGNPTSKGLQLRDNGSGVDLESIGVPLYVNYTTKEPLYLNTNNGAVGIAYSGDLTEANEPSLIVGGITRSDGGTIVSALFSNDVIMEEDLTVNGTTNDVVDHPIRPTEQYLAHTSINSSEALNQYSGNVTTDDLGIATVQLPDWFEAENADFRYQLTVVDERFAQAIVSKRIANNRFTIGTNAPHIQVSWQVTAKRNDLYTRAHPFAAEREKPASKRGHYSHPELYGHTEERGAQNVANTSLSEDRSGGKPIR